MPKAIARILTAVLLLSINVGPLAAPAMADAPTFEITELFPDPASPLTDADDEFIEFHNLTNGPVDITGYVIKTGTNLSTSHTLAQATIPAGGYVALKSAATKIALANAGSSVAVFDPAKNQVGETISYGTAPTGSAWAKGKDGTWKWSATPTPDAENEITAAGKGGQPSPTSPVAQVGDEPEAAAELMLTELFPDPKSPQTDAADEFVELYNPNGFPVDAGRYVIKTGASLSTKHTLPSAVINAGAYMAFKSAATKIALSNSGSSVALFDPAGNQLGETITYPKAIEGASWALNGDTWGWSTTLTPGAANVITAAPASAAAGTSSSKSTTTKASSSKSSSKSKATSTPKATTAKSTSGSSLVGATTSPGGHWLLFILAAATIGYIIYEFRHDLRNFYHKLRGYPGGRPPALPAPVGRGDAGASE
ncbi:MAG TPA: lamin tail domain-containing protein [Candidatus Saccharimonadia bacterium]|jgi:hypothetical protein|nr:lamin tail domain-containing protein [Candidatus Saccharimonadia bacterium]